MRSMNVLRSHNHEIFAETVNKRPVYTTPDFWYGTDKNGTGAKKKEFGSFIYTSIFSRAKQFYFCVWYANQTQMFVQDSVSKITSTQYACVLCCFKMADGEFPEEFLFNFFKQRRLPYRKLEQLLNVSIRWLSLLSGCSHYQYYYKLHYI